ncbi:hypothetical protein A0H81_07387 [Grifola frondosa]|uniref:Uncharacterized protein n=1 Tax=Grifola frondosa TaxID=5627 RepID=A0A1C7M6X2_GRIFR|nr:hypothetical protein A0H81_07387 [Grifola frondosa]
MYSSSSAPPLRYGQSSLASGEEAGDVLHLENDDSGFLELCLNLLSDDSGGGDGAAVEDLDAVVGGVGTADEEDIVAAGEGSAARRADAEVALEAGDEEGGIVGDELGEAVAGKGIVLALVEHGLVRTRGVHKLPAGGSLLVGLAGVAAVADVHDERGRGARASVREYARGIITHGVGGGDAERRVGDHGYLNVEQEEDALGRGDVRRGGGGDGHRAKWEI